MCRFRFSKFPVLQVCALLVVSFPCCLFNFSHCKGSARRMQSRARSSYAEPQPSLAVYSQMHCKVTTKTTSFQISTPVACKNPLRNRGNFVNKYKLWQSLPETMAVSLRECGTFLQRLRHQKVTGNR